MFFRFVFAFFCFVLFINVVIIITNIDFFYKCVIATNQNCTIKCQCVQKIVNSRPPIPTWYHWKGVSHLWETEHMPGTKTIE